MLQVVNITETDGALGAAVAGDRLLAVVGPSTAGPLNTPAAYSRDLSLIATFGTGAAVEAAVTHIKMTGKPVVFVRTGSTVAGTKDTIDVTGVLGTSVVTANATVPTGDYDLYFKVITGGTVGTAGITFQSSYDDGRTLGPVTALGTANTYAFSEAGGAGFAFGVGTLLAGAVVRQRVRGPNWNATELGTALTALQNTALAWECAEIVGALDATTLDTVTLAFASMPERFFVGHVRRPNAGESAATYLASLTTAFSAKASTQGGLVAGEALVTSGVNSRSYVRSPVDVIASWIMKFNEGVDASAPALGGIPGVSVRDANGNPAYNDEAANPGLDDARFITLRTISDFSGVFLTNPRLFSASGSDFEFVQHRRIMILARRALRRYFTKRLSLPIAVSRTTGLILETEALEIEKGARTALAAELLAGPKASDVDVTLSRTDVLLSTKTLTVSASIVPLAYPKAINVELGFKNPALQITKR